jgi:hypothetical protein
MGRQKAVSKRHQARIGVAQAADLSTLSFGWTHRAFLHSLGPLQSFKRFRQAVILHERMPAFVVYLYLNLECVRRSRPLIRLSFYEIEIIKLSRTIQLVPQSLQNTFR